MEKKYSGVEIRPNDKVSAFTVGYQQAIRGTCICAKARRTMIVLTQVGEEHTCHKHGALILERQGSPSEAL